MGRIVGITLVVPIMAAVMSSCAGSDERTVDAFCAEVSAVEDQARDIGADLEATDDPLVGIVKVFGALGDIPTMMRRLESKAPEEIHADMTRIADTFEESYDPSASIDNPLKALFGNVVSGLMIQNHLQRVDDFAVDNCGVRIFGT